MMEQIIEVQKMKIENKTTHKTKFFARRDKFINWLKQQNPNVPERDMLILRSEALVEKYLKDWFVVARE